MKNLVLFTGALVCLESPAFASTIGKTCESLFEKNNTFVIEEITVYDANVRFQQKAISEVELNEMMINKPAPEARTVVYGNKSALSDGQTVVIEAVLPSSKKVFQREFDLKSTKGSFEQSTGNYWIMTRNQGRVVIWNYAKDRVIDVSLPKDTELSTIAFDLTTNIFEPTVTIFYRELFPLTTNGFSEIRVNLINGQQI